MCRQMQGEPATSLHMQFTLFLQPVITHAFFIRLQSSTSTHTVVALPCFAQCIICAESLERFLTEG